MEQVIDLVTGTGRKRCACCADVKRFICPVLAVMPIGADFRPIAEPLCQWCSMPGVGSCCATLSPLSLSVIMMRGTRHCRFSSLDSVPGDGGNSARAGG